MKTTNYLIERILEINQMKEANELTESMAKYWLKACIKRAKKNEKENTLELLIGFLIYLNDNGLINNHDFDYEKWSKTYYKEKLKKR